MTALLLLLIAASPDGGYPFHAEEVDPYYYKANVVWGSYFAKNPIQLDTSRYAVNSSLVVDGGQPPPWHGAHWSDATWFQRQGFFECREPIVYWKYDVGGTTYWSYEQPDDKKATRLMMCRDDVPPPPPCPIPCSIGCDLRYSVETALCTKDAGS